MNKHSLPTHRTGHTFKIEMGGVEGYVNTGEWEDGSLGEIFIHLTKSGSTLMGWADAFAIAFSGCLQFADKPEEALRWLASKLEGHDFEPKGHTMDPEVPSADSVVDFIVRKLDLLYLQKEER